MNNIISRKKDILTARNGKQTLNLYCFLTSRKDRYETMFKGKDSVLTQTFSLKFEIVKVNFLKARIYKFNVS